MVPLTPFAILFEAVLSKLATTVFEATEDTHRHSNKQKILVDNTAILSKNLSDQEEVGRLVRFCGGGRRREEEDVWEVSVSPSSQPTTGRDEQQMFRHFIILPKSLLSTNPPTRPRPLPPLTLLLRPSSLIFFRIEEVALFHLFLT